MNEDAFSAAREDMIEHQLRQRGVVNEQVLGAMSKVPRHLFVSPEFEDRAYEDEALPSMEGQTISQPYMVGMMTQQLAAEDGHKVLEIGTGTGYQTAILAEIVGTAGIIYTIERDARLAGSAQWRLDKMAITNVEFFVGDGSAGWPEKGAVFDRILVTAGAPEIPVPLLAQLRENGVMVVPVGDRASQKLLRVVKRSGSQRGYEELELFKCRFVPLVGQHGWSAADVKE
ncbi:MAG TPA: protein-L-isoaspartate(D-aspartate) O-methyltransferase [Phycisphaerae bacterium]|jgi:protein-L-isoaspartate(D-aspartate) O-methyltransferase